MLIAVVEPSAVAHAQPADQAITMPKLLEPLAPEYPSTGVGNARVLLRVVLDKQGAVTGVEVVSGDEPYASAAVRAAEKGKFAAARRGDVPIAAKIVVAVDFTFSAPEPKLPEPPPPERVPLTPEPSRERVPEPKPPAAEEAPVEIVVSAPRVDDTERSINKAEARLMAGTFGDPLRAVELLPGILPVISGVPYFFVRGAPPGSVAFYIDEARLPQLYHVGPGSSVLHPRLVEAVALRSGPYRARYGDATSGVVTTRLVSDVTDFGAELEAKVFESSAYVGAPILRGRGTLAAAGKVSHLGPVLELTNPELRLRYWDYQSLASHRPSSRDQLSLLAFGASDFVGEEESGVVDINIDTIFHRLKLGYTRNLAEGVDVQNFVILGLENARFDTEEEEFAARSAGAGTVLSYVVDDRWEWAMGMSVEATDYDASGAAEFLDDGSNVAVSRVDTQGAIWVEGRVRPGSRVSIDAGLRAAAYKSREEKATALEPRVTSTIKLTERWKSILAVGYSTQTPSFTVPTPAVRPADLRGGLQKSLQRAATLRYAVPGTVTAEATLFYNDYQDLSDPLSLSTVPDPLEVGDTPDGDEPAEEDLNFEERPSGRSVGLELILRRPFSNKLSGSLAYTLSRSTRRIAGTDIPSSFDRTHVLNLTAGYDLGRGYNLSTRLLFYSGLPVRRTGETLGRTGDRSDPFVRWDVRFSKEWKHGWSDVMLIVEMLNATFQEEVLGVACTPDGCESATFGPVSIPSIGLRGTFGGSRESSDSERAQLD